MGKKYFGTDGIRGKVGEFPITADFVLKLGWAAGRVLAAHRAGERPSKVLIGKDTRISGYMFESALQAGLSAAGVDIRLLGPMPTPGIAYLTRTLHAQAGIVISASHNPYYDNGIKFFSAEGTKLADEVELAIEEHMDKPMTTMDSAELGKAERVGDAAGRYIEFCKSTVALSTEFRPLTIVVDCAHGATYHVAPSVFEEMGATVVRLGTEPNGLNINDGCGSTDPRALQQAVLARQADLGIGLDGDGDRVVMVDHKGELVDGDELLYIIARSRQREGRLNGAVVGTVMTNLGLEHALQRLGIGLARTPVGDRYILEHQQQNGCTLGGEPSGHIICMDCTTTGDGIVSALQVLAEMRSTRQSLSELKAGVKKYPQTLLNVRMKERLDLAACKPVQEGLREAERRLGERGRVVLRASGTEPVVRIMVEGEDADLVNLLARHLASVVAAAAQ